MFPGLFRKLDPSPGVNIIIYLNQKSSWWKIKLVTSRLNLMIEINIFQQYNNEK